MDWDNNTPFNDELSALLKSQIFANIKCLLHITKTTAGERCSRFVRFHVAPRNEKALRQREPIQGGRVIELCCPRSDTELSITGAAPASHRLSHKLRVSLSFMARRFACSLGTWCAPHGATFFSFSPT